MTTRVERVQAQSTPQTKAKAQPQKKENIVIEFSSLPENLKTEKVRKFYDKDGSRFLESNNANGQNEIDLMAKAFNLDLSKYKSNIVRTEKKVMRVLVMTKTVIK